MESKIKRRKIQDIVNEVKEAIESEPTKEQVPIRFEEVVSTGSTLLDLAISGDKVRGGGIPGGIIMEIFGPTGSGKTAILSEIVGSAQRKGGDVFIDDPEGRIDEEYAEIYGVEINKENYTRSDTVSEVFRGILQWEPHPKRENAICVRAIDSLAALSTEDELEREEGDKRGQLRAKEFSSGFRKTCRLIAKKNWLIVCTNQLRMGDEGYTTPGGLAVPFYSSLRIQVKPAYPTWAIQKKITVSGKEIKKTIGILSTCKIVKSTIAPPFREANVSIIFNYGIDSLRDELQYLKDMTGSTKYWAVDREFQSMEKAIEYVEQDEKLRNEVRNRVIDLWEEIERKFTINRKPKMRF